MLYADADAATILPTGTSIPPLDPATAFPLVEYAELTGRLRGAPIHIEQAWEALLRALDHFELLAAGGMSAENRVHVAVTSPQGRLPAETWNALGRALTFSPLPLLRGLTLSDVLEDTGPGSASGPWPCEPHRDADLTQLSPLQVSPAQPEPCSTPKPDPGNAS